MVMSPGGLLVRPGTDPSSHERGHPISTNPLSDRNKNLVTGPRWVPDTKTNGPTDHRS
jgi:hypothetical protein